MELVIRQLYLITQQDHSKPNECDLPVAALINLQAKVKGFSDRRTQALSKPKADRARESSFKNTGTSTVSPGTKIKSGQVYNSNHFTIHSMLNRLNVECIDLGLIPDSKIIIKNTLLKASNVADVIITTGGVSVGDADYMKEVLKEIGQVLF